MLILSNTMKYKYIDDLTSDVMFEAYGKTLKELLENAAEAMFETVCKLKKIKPEKEISIDAEAETEKTLLVAWLQKLIAAVDTEEMFFSKFKIIEIKTDDKDKEKKIKLKAKIHGEPITPEKGETVVKAVAYYKLLLEKNKKGYRARVSLDI